MRRGVRHTHSEIEMTNRFAGANHKLRVYSNITQLIASPENPTPLVRLNRINPKRDFKLYLKLERYNPFGSVKDRIAHRMLAALDVGNKTVVEPSSGNTGIALTCIANALGLPIEIAVPDKIPAEKKDDFPHSGQHTRQLMLVLEKLGLTPDSPLPDQAFAGLPMPRKVWDNELAWEGAQR